MNFNIYPINIDDCFGNILINCKNRMVGAIDSSLEWKANSGKKTGTCSVNTIRSPKTRLGNSAITETMSGSFYVRHVIQNNHISFFFLSSTCCLLEIDKWNFTSFPLLHKYYLVTRENPLWGQLWQPCFLVMLFYLFLKSYLVQISFFYLKITNCFMRNPFTTSAKMFDLYCFEI